MEFDKSRVYTSLNADELKVGSKVICAFTISDLKKRVDEEEQITEVYDILSEGSEHRIKVYFDDGYFSYSLAYLVSEPEEKKLKWTDLKIGDVIRHKESGVEYMGTGIDKRSTSYHINFDNGWSTDYELAEHWEKVEE